METRQIYVKWKWKTNKNPHKRVDILTDWITQTHWTYWDLEMCFCSTQTTRGSDCDVQGLKLMPFDSEIDKWRKRGNSFPKTCWINTHTTSKSHFLHYHPDTKPLYTHSLDLITHTHPNPLTMNPVWFSLASVLQRGADNPRLWDIIRICSI